eukprot:CAMPEP_0204493634 /NCGR_PEP_ID=MMETSP0471-20130131/82518_1 /ASSEMBLY_ACC=CAM_ASM_000602 /TAXON_ID=2969 /ORGANISM="Oxyrrhis marina" /LENGTH=32 /DNA_ID= /DNA_START= /DNA_END= /DNA_ORIENTATION=
MGNVAPGAAWPSLWVKSSMPTPVPKRMLFVPQ